MTIRLAACGLLSLFSACSVTSPHVPSTAFPKLADEVTTPGDPAPTRTPAAGFEQAPAPAGPALGGTGTGDSFAAGPIGTELDARRTAPQQYEPSALFMKAHGDFMLAREPWRPSVQASGFLMSDVEVKGESGDFNLEHFKFDVERRIHTGYPDSFLDVGLQYGNRQYDFSAGATGADDDDLHRASMTVTYGQFINADTLVELEFTPGVWSDFSDSTLHHEDWQFYGRALATFRYSKDLFVSAGVEYSELFRDFDVHPVLGVAWVIDKEWRLDMLLPRQLRLSYSPSPHDSIYLSLDLEGGEYQIRADSPGRTPRSVNVQEFEISLGGLHRFNESISVDARVGMVMGGDYRFLNNTAVDYDGQLEPQIFVEVGVGWNF